MQRLYKDAHPQRLYYILQIVNRKYISKKSPLPFSRTKRIFIFHNESGDLKIMYTILMLLIILAGIFMTIAILMQNPKGGGLSSAFGGAGGGFGSMLGVRHASDILAKTTWGLAIGMTVLIFMLNMFFLPTQGTEESIIQRGSADQPMTPVQKSQQMQTQQPTQTPAGQTPAGQTPAGQTPAGQTPGQQAPGRNTPAQTPPSDNAPGK